ncbi:MAG: aspartyl/asparaginyl beta-hydroxylase domain-containing protein [Solirubrobacteraceae bacterium]|nr:aspartyl/asparaginyl beta-hydroxylase domain-containing protein [Patulibacter sp.]
MTLLDHAGSQPATLPAHERDLARGPAPQRRRKRPDRRAQLVELSTKTGRHLVAPIERWIGRHSPVGDTPFYDDAQFPWIEEIEAHWTEIRDELEAVLGDRESIPAFQEVSTDQKSLSDDDRWKTYFLFGFGHEVPEHLAECPRTAELLRSIPGMKTAMFSILAPGKHIPPHRGPYKGVLRYHLGLVVPDPADRSRIRVDQEIRHWLPGKSMVFDDTYEHEVWNDTTGERVVLFVDVVRPLTGIAKPINDAVLWAIAHSPLVTDAVRRQREIIETRRGRAKNAA